LGTSVLRKIFCGFFIMVAERFEICEPASDGGMTLKWMDDSDRYVSYCSIFYLSMENVEALPAKQPIFLAKYNMILMHIKLLMDCFCRC
jgi:hypothetical protein